MSDWRSTLKKRGLSRDEFLQLCETAIKDLFPELTVVPTDVAGSYQVQRRDEKPFTAHLDNLWINCRLDSDGRAAEVERFLKILFTDNGESDAPPPTDFIVPTIKDEEYLSMSWAQQGDKPSLVYEHLVADLWIVYAIDWPEKIVSLKKSDFERLRLRESELRTLAISNLKRILPPIELHGEGPLYMLTAGADYVASLVLFDDLWDEMRPRVDGEIVAAVPSRDVLLFTGSRSPEGICSMRSRVDRITKTGNYLVSPSMIRRHEGAWLLFS